MKILRAWTVVTALWTAAPCEAQDAAPDPQLQAFIQSAPYQQNLARVFATLPEVVFKRCPSLVSNGSKITPLRPVTFGANGEPNGGTWVQHFPVSGCGNDTVMNLFFAAAPDGKISTLFAAPGTTHADLLLQRDSLMYANAGASLALKDCKTFVVRNTKFGDYGAPLASLDDPGHGPKRPWWETWTMAGCDKIVDVPINFIPDATGTLIIQHGGTLVQ